MKEPDYGGGALRCKIAWWMGWQPYPMSGTMGYSPTRFNSIGQKYREIDTLPDYANDLNAIHDAEQKLFPTDVHELYQKDKFAEYRARLELLSFRNAGGALRATARQRAEALAAVIEGSK